MDEVHKILCSMGVDEEAKAKFTTYQLKDVAQILYQMWTDSRARGGVPITSEVLNTTFLERFCPRDKREAKV